jgi:hypothetical protein
MLSFQAMLLLANLTYPNPCDLSCCCSTISHFWASEMPGLCMQT